jgi:hypothetical protein
MIRQAAICFIKLIVFMAQILLAVLFILLIEWITYAQNHSEGIYLNWLYILYAYISIAFSMVARRSNYLSMYGYLLFVAAYTIFALSDTLAEFNVILSDNLMSDNYVNVMITLIAILIILSWYDRMDAIQHRTFGFMPKFGPNPNLHSEVSP